MISPLTTLWKTGLRSVWHRGRIWITASGVAAGIVGLRLTGVLQLAEFALYDQMFRWRPLEVTDDRIVLVTIEESDLERLNQWPMSDRQLNGLLIKITQAKPRAIGLDLYRNFAIAPGESELRQTFQTTSNLVGINKLKDRSTGGVGPNPVLAQNKQVGFNNIIYDDDQRNRRSLLYWSADGKSYESFALKLALLYLQPIEPQAASRNQAHLQLGRVEFPQFKSNDGIYAQANAGAYQVISNFRSKPGQFRRIKLMDLLEDRVDPRLMQDRIVMVGSMASSLNDEAATPYGKGSGVELQANFVSEIISSVLDGRSLLHSLPEGLEWTWILGWAWVGTVASWRLRSPQKSLLVILVASATLIGMGFIAFLAGWILPTVPPLLALMTAATVVTGYIAHSEEELKRSKEFLHRIINSIPDPIFVKDKHHRWIVINEAYARFVGKPIEELVGQSVYEVFPTTQAKTFWDQDDWVFRHQIEQENEETFTNLHGLTYHIATKRSLHKDSAGNLLLVGVIRDITKRKSIEDALKRTTAELSRSNAELRMSQDHLSYLANHDSLTGLPNRKLFRERLTESLVWARQRQQQVALLFLDLDGFKAINDSLGHGVGDLLLQAVAGRLSTCLRGSDTVARLGGDEFVVILPAIPGDEEAKRVARKILSTLAKSFSLDSHAVQVTTSIGISLFPNNSEDPDLLIEMADNAMYQAKGLGKNRFAMVSGLPAMPQP
jgi:diguanylate cyclase (GGDEF)-like protein/PAS domain S-box-containing protein